MRYNKIYTSVSPSSPVNWCLKDEGRAMPSPGGKGDREAVDEERRNLTIHNAVK